jgi:hypothetical protein
VSVIGDPAEVRGGDKKSGIFDIFGTEKFAIFDKM